MASRHLARARRLFGKRAVVKRERSGRYGGKGPMAGRCSTCLKPDCKRRWSCTIGTLEIPQ